MIEDGGRRREGYLVIADIAGYTAFLTGSELEHAQSIIHELTTLIRERLAPPLRFVKLEGDAVFCYADAETIKNGERLIELIEVCYFEFSNLLFNMVRSTTCACTACASIGSLDLKFIAHYGAYVVQRDGATEDLVGPDVILAHRLLKNTITVNTGIRPYAFFTDACLGQLPPSFDLPPHGEEHESFGETRGGVYDLAPMLREMRDARREYVSAEEADHEELMKVPYPPVVVWQYLVDPVQRLRWACVLFNKDPDADQPNKRGRQGVGSTNHCNHAPAEAYREFVDWRPFAYFTLRGTVQVRGRFLPRWPLLETYELTPRPDGGTVLAWRLRFLRRPGRLSRVAFGVALRLLIQLRYKVGDAKLRAAIEEDLSRFSSASEANATTSS